MAGRPSAISRARLGPDSVPIRSTGITGRAAASTSVMRWPVSISMPLLALTTIASREMCGARRSAFARIVWEGTTTMTTTALAHRRGEVVRHPQRIGQPHVGEARGMVARGPQHRRLVRSTRPQRRRHAVTRQQHGEGQAPRAGADDSSVLGRLEQWSSSVSRTAMWRSARLRRDGTPAQRALPL